MHCGTVYDTLGQADGGLPLTAQRFVDAGISDI
jgi:hypothetical protein